MKIAFVAPFFGRDTAGGAEAACRNLAIRLAAHGFEVDVLATRCRDLHHDWAENYYPAGPVREDGLCIRRFEADRADLGPLADLNTRLIAGLRLSRAEELRFMALHVNSAALYRHLAAHAKDYDWIAFIPYLFGIAVHGTRLCPDRAVLIPCLHDEGYAHMSIMRDLFARCARFVFHSEPEARLARRLFGVPPERGVVLGSGVDPAPEADGERFRRRYGIDGPFLLYAGRKDATKNVPALIRDFAAWHSRRNTDVSLVLIGPERAAIPPDAAGAIRDLGFVPPADRQDAFAAAAILCQPSRNESFSLVMMEAWLCGKPCIVDAACAVTRDHVVRSGGGLYTAGGAEFGAALDRILGDPSLARAMGEHGRAYVQARYRWDRIIERCRTEVFPPREAGGQKRRERGG